MKVIFLKDNPSGKKDEIKEVSRGHALNYLLPHKITVVATPEKINSLQHQISPAGKNEEKINTQTKKIVNTLKKLKVEIKAKANPAGHLFGGISNEDIQKILQEKHNLEINKEAIELPHHLKEIGEHEIDLKIDNHKTKLKIIIKAE